MAISYTKTPYLDKLESVATTSRRMMVLGSILLIIVMGAICYSIMKNVILRYVDSLFTSVGIIGFIMILAPALIAVLLIMSMLESNNWKTTKDYIVKFGLFSEERLFWDGITRAEGHIVERKTGNILPDADVDDDTYGRDYVITLWCGGRSLKIESKDPFLIASILMHLNRYGMGESIVPPGGVSELLIPPSDKEIPEITWHLKSNSLWRRYAVILIMMGVLALFTYFICTTPRKEIRFFDYYIAIWMGSFLIFHIRMELYTAFGLKIEPDKFIAQTILGESAMKWKDVTDAKWDSLAYKNEGLKRRYKDAAPSKIALGIRMRWMKTVYIPWDPKDEESTRLIRAIMDRLKQLPNPIILLPLHKELDGNG